MESSIANQYVLENEFESHRLDFQAQNHNYDPYQELQADEMELFDSQRILDAGCGSGACSKLLMSFNKNVSIDAVDFSETRINQLKFELKNHQIRFHQQNLKNLTFENDSFDMAICRFVYQHNPIDSQLITNEIYRILKPGGKYILIDADGVFYNIETENKFILDCLRKIRSQFLNYEGYVCRKIPRYLARAGFKIEKIKPIPILFVNQEDRQHEHELWKMRFTQIEHLLSPILENDLDRFRKGYLHEVLNSENFLYYNKFVFFAER